MLHRAGADTAFGHREHLEFAWAVLDEADDVADAERVICLTIRHAATAAGNPDKFHLTMTLFWVRLLERARQSNPGMSALEDALAEFPELADPKLHEQHWSDIDAGGGRSHWVEPDLRPLP